jgi:hypothetical protein
MVRKVRAGLLGGNLADVPSVFRRWWEAGGAVALNTSSDEAIKRALRTIQEFRERIDKHTAAWPVIS